MKKEDMAAAMGGITTRQRTTPKNISIMQDNTKTSLRKVISITYADYKAIKNFANDHDISITAAVSQIVEYSTIL